MTYQSFQQYTVSGVNSFTLTAIEILDEALDILGIGVDGEDMEPEYYARLLKTLNLVLRYMQSQGLHLNTFSTGTLFLEAGKFQYNIEKSSSTNQYFSNETNADLLATATTLTFDNVPQETVFVDDEIIIEQNDKSYFKSTVVSFTSTEIEIADGLPADLPEGSAVYTYSSELMPISRIMHIWRRDADNPTSDVPIELISKQEYDWLPNKNTSGLPSQAYYQRLDPEGILYLWQAPQNDSDYIVQFDYERKIDDMKDPTDKLDMNRTYLPAVIYTTALWGADKFQVSSEIRQRVEMRQKEIMEQALSYDDEVTDIQISLQRV